MIPEALCNGHEYNSLTSHQLHSIACSRLTQDLILNQEGGEEGSTHLQEEEGDLHTLAEAVGGIVTPEWDGMGWDGI